MDVSKLYAVSKHYAVKISAGESSENIGVHVVTCSPDATTKTNLFSVFSSKMFDL